MDQSSNSLYRIEGLKGEENYGVWKTKMIDILTSTDFMEHADGTAAEPNDPAAKAAWQKKDRMALSAIRLRVADHVLVYVSGAKTAAEAWKTLRDTYEPSGPIGIVLARRKFFRAECAEGGDIQEHIRTLRSYQTELATLGQKVEETDFSMTLLTSLPESWNSFISSVDETFVDPPRDGHHPSWVSGFALSFVAHWTARR
jgi:hypothetical protein